MHRRSDNRKKAGRGCSLGRHLPDEGRKGERRDTSENTRTRRRKRETRVAHRTAPVHTLSRTDLGQRSRVGTLQKSGACTVRAPGQNEDEEKKEKERDRQKERKKEETLAHPTCSKKALLRSTHASAESAEDRTESSLCFSFYLSLSRFLGICMSVSIRLSRSGGGILRRRHLENPGDSTVQNFVSVCGGEILEARSTTRSPGKTRPSLDLLDC